MGTQLRGDFIGFSFGGVHSSELGIIRTSDGSRYNENLLPTIQDKTVQIPGGDGMYYFGSHYTQKQINISIAYDNLTEKQLNLIKKTFSSKTLKRLVFDEHSDRYYIAKCTGTPTLKYICFDENNSQGRIYKGEGTLNFICYDPFAYSEKKVLNLNIINNNLQCLVLNEGDFPTDWVLTIFGENGGGTLTKPLSFRISCEDNEIVVTNLFFKGEDNAIIINSKTNLLQGAIKNQNIVQLSSNIYNDCFSGSFFKINASQYKEQQKIIFSSENEHTKIEKLEYQFKFI